MDVQGVFIFTASSMDMQFGIPFFTTISMDVQGVSISTASSMGMQGVSISNTRIFYIKDGWNEKNADAKNSPELTKNANAEPVWNRNN
jgi:hypothetical protein